MQRSILVSLLVAAAFLICGTVFGRFSELWGALFGSFGLLVVVFSLGVAFAAYAIEDGEKGGRF